MTSRYSQPKKIFIDFDVTLLNTRLFKKSYFKEFEKFGVTAKKAEEVYEEMKKIIGKDNPYFHTNHLAKSHPKLDTKNLKKSLIRFRSQSKKYIFGDVPVFLKHLLKNEWRAELLSIGYRPAQNKKVQGSGLVKFFNKIHVIDSDNKSDHLKKILKRPDDHFVFIDDNIHLVEDVKKNFPKAIVMQIMRYPDQKRSARVDYIVPNLHEVMPLLEDLTR